MVKNSIMRAWAVIGIALTAFLFFIVIYSAVNSDKPVDGLASTVSDVQIVYLTTSGYNYVLSPSIIKKDIKVKMIVDTDTVKGCFRSINIPDFGIVNDNDDIIYFMPNKLGTFKIVCSMNMGVGSFTVI